MLYKATPDSLNEELIVVALVATCYSLFVVTVQLEGNVTKRTYTVAVAATALAVSLSAGSVALIWQLTSQGIVPELPYSWTLFNSVVFSTFISRELWHSWKPKVPPAILQALPQSGDVKAARRLLLSPEPGATISVEPNWERALDELVACGPNAGASRERLAHLVSLRRIHDMNLPLVAKHTLNEETQRLIRAAQADAKEEKSDLLAQAATVLEWGLRNSPSSSNLT